jgi:hypothetical protein
MTGVKGVQEHTRLFRDFRECEVGLPAESVCLSSYSVLGILDLILHVRFPTFLQKKHRLLLPGRIGCVNSWVLCLLLLDKKVELQLRVLQEFHVSCCCMF